MKAHFKYNSHIQLNTRPRRLLNRPLPALEVQSASQPVSLIDDLSLFLIACCQNFQDHSVAGSSSKEAE